MATLFIILVVVVLVIVVAVKGFNGIIEKNQANLAAGKIELEERFGPGDYHLESPDLRCIGINWKDEVVILGDTPSTASTVPLANVRAADIEVDGVNVTESRTTTKTNRGSQLVGSAIGSLLGPAGMIVGGLSGGSTTTGRAVESRKIKTVRLVIRVNDRLQPLRTFMFVNGQFGDGLEADSPLIKPSIEKAAHFHALLTQVIEDRVHTDADARSRSKSADPV